jgi:Domain of unknown function (DUF4333)
MSVFRPARLLAAGPLLLVALAACGTSPLPAEDVAEKAEDALEEQIGARPEISCPDDLEAEVGTEMRCTLTAGGDPTEFGVTITVTSVEDENVNFDVEVDDAPADG